jgi:acylglycerol lipase
MTHSDSQAEERAMQGTTGEFIGARNTRIVYGRWQGESGHAVVIIAHGFGEHKGRYRNVIEALSQHGYTVYIPDHRGHGQSGGLRFYVDRFDDFVADLDRLVEIARRDHPGLPIFLIGHSMGGLIATRYALRHQHKLAGLVVSAAALIIGSDVSPWLKRASALLATVAPRALLVPASKSAESVLSRDPEVQRLWDSDPLTHKGKVRARFGHEFMMAGIRTRPHLSKITLPLLVMYGACDNFVGGSQQIYDDARSADKTLRVWPECRHEIFNELEKDEIIAYLIDWLHARVHRSPQSSPALATA